MSADADEFAGMKWPVRELLFEVTGQAERIRASQRLIVAKGFAAEPYRNELIRAAKLDRVADMLSAIELNPRKFYEDFIVPRFGDGRSVSSKQDDND